MFYFLMLSEQVQISIHRHVFDASNVSDLDLVVGVGFCCWLVSSCFGSSCVVVSLFSLCTIRSVRGSIYGFQWSHGWRGPTYPGA